jgi:hypothetical protein
MPFSLKIMGFLLVSFCFCSCDPALTIVLVNNSTVDVEIPNFSSLADCYSLSYDDDYPVDSSTIVLYHGAENAQNFNLGMGGWRKEEVVSISSCLDSMLLSTIQLKNPSVELTSESDLSGYSKNILTYGFKVSTKE